MSVKNQVKTFLIMLTLCIYALLFLCVLGGIKRDARLIQSTRRSRVATSSRVKTLLWLVGSSYEAAVR